MRDDTAICGENVGDMPYLIRRSFIDAPEGARNWAFFKHIVSLMEPAVKSLSDAVQDLDPVSNLGLERITADIGREGQIAQDFTDAVIASAHEAQKKGQYIILALEEGWLEGLGRPQEIMSALDELPAKLKQRGLDNVIFLRGEGDSMAGKIVEARKNRESAIPFSNIIVLGSPSITTSGEFKKLRGDKPQDSAMLIGIDKGDIGLDSGIRLFEMYLLAMRINSVEITFDMNEDDIRKKYEECIESLDTEFVNIEFDKSGNVRSFVFRPTKPYNINVKQIYKMQTEKVDSQA